MATGLLLAVTLIFFSGLFQGRTYSDVSRFQRAAVPWGDPSDPPVDDRLVHLDQAKSYYPWQVFMSRSYQDREVPLWNPYAFAGTPFVAANGNNALYPPRVALSLTQLSPSRVHDVFVASHMLLAGLGMYLLLAYFRSSFLGALLGAVAWMASSFMLAWIALEHFTVVAALFPVAVLLADASIRRRSWPATLALGPVLALLFLGGNVLFVELCLVVVGTYMAALLLARLLRARSARPAHRRHTGSAGDLARLLVPWALFVGLSFIALLPTLELAQSTDRSPLSYSELKGYALPWRQLIRLFVPPDTRSYFFVSDLYNAYHVALYAGPAVALLAFVGVWTRRPGAWLARVLAALTLIVVLATPALALPYLSVPGFDNFKPLGRALFLVAFAVAMLAAFGLDRVSGWIQRLIGGQRGARASLLVGLTAVVLTVISMRVYSAGVMHDQAPTAQQTFPETPLVARLRQDESVRFMSVGGALPGSTALVYPVRNAVGYESLVPARVQDFWRVVAGLPIAQLNDPLSSAFEPIPEFGFMRSDLLWRAGIGYVVAPPRGDGRDPSVPDQTRLDRVYSETDGRLYAVRGALPRAYFVEGCVSAPESRAALALFEAENFDPRGTVIIEDDPDHAQVSCSAAAGATGDARIVDEKVNSLTVEVDAPTRGFLVVNDTWAPGWRATVDGAGEGVLPANALFRAVPVEAGRHTVELEYRPRSYVIGRALTTATLLLLFALVGALLWRRARHNRVKG